ncbi:V-set and transmembrane domain-containing protein 2-like protein isoform X1 [Entelurus aequoreus]|uniref:V-set and transmembrane domain-containing protein 2-like protein isoform X1 n=2 Tax=Entelurus aequoreus TaxID=161455 RepID=UPI002B1DE5CE|nr:V-set and transmembrane domain-containing protein 2-like protein isoform X1 [Entelurus aequoreus]
MRAIVGLAHYVGLYLQLHAALVAGHVELENHLSANALFTEVPHDVSTQSGVDVEMACSFRGAGLPSSLEIQWWYVKDHRDWLKEPPQITNDVVPLEKTFKDATKISVVKVAGSNISHKLRLSSVKPSDEGTYECRVIDFSGSEVQHHRVRAYLHVEPHRGPGVRRPDDGEVRPHKHDRRHRKAEEY